MSQSTRSREAHVGPHSAFLLVLLISLASLVLPVQAASSSDLTVESIWLERASNPGEPVIEIAPGEEFLIVATVKNLGESAALGYYVDVYLDGEYGRGGPDDIAPGEAQGWYVGQFTAQSGTHTTKWVVDPDSQIAELDELNNEKEYAFTIGAPPMGAPTLTLSPTSGPVGTVVSASGSNYQGTTCQLTSNPPGLFTSSSCSLASGSLTEGSEFTLDPGAAVGTSYTVTATTDHDGESATATFTVTETPIHGVPTSFGPTVSALLDAPAGTVYFIFPDGDTAHEKLPGVGYASVTDWTALGYVYGMMSNMPQVTVLDTDGTYVDPDTGAPLLRNSTIVLFGGPLVNAVVHYYEENRIAPLWWSLEGGWSSGTLYYRACSGEVGASIPIQTVGGGSEDLVLVESFTDQFGNSVIVFAGFGWKATFAAGLYSKTVLSDSANLLSLTDSWYFYSWSDLNGNGFAEYDEVSSTPYSSGN